MQEGFYAGIDTLLCPPPLTKKRLPGEDSTRSSSPGKSRPTCAGGFIAESLPH